jgi:hypothetical protein
VRGHGDLRLAVAVAIVGALLATVLPWELARLVAAAPLALFLPGYAISAAAFGSQRLAAPQLLMLSFGCSVAVLALGALPLHFLPGGVQTVSWALLLLTVVIVACRVAALRRGEEQPREIMIPRPSPHPLGIACGVLGIAAATAALVLANTPLSADSASGYTALWMLPTREAPRNAVKVGVVSNEQDERFYVLELKVDTRRPRVVARFALGPGEERTFRPATPTRGAKPVAVTAILLHSNRPQRIYRKVRTWLPPTVQR